MLKIKCTLLIILLFIYKLNAQEEHPKTYQLKAHLVSLKLLGSPSWPLGISYGQMLTNKLSMEIGVGFFSSGVGFDYYFTNLRKHRFNMNTGLYGSINYDGFPMIYLPLGFSYLSKGNFQFNLNAGALYSENVSSLENGENISPWFGLTISKRFGQDVETLKNVQKIELKNIISARFGFISPYIGINYERLFNANIGIEATVGFLGVSTGVNFYLQSLKPGKIGFKTGINQGILIIPLLGIETSTYLPFGLTYLSKNCYVLSLDFGPQYWHNDNDFLAGYSIKIGKAF